MSENDEVMVKGCTCKFKIVDGFIVFRCDNKKTYICFPGIRSKSGGFSILGTGANGVYEYPDFECYSIEEIVEKK